MKDYNQLVKQMVSLRSTVDGERTSREDSKYVTSYMLSLTLSLFRIYRCILAYLNYRVGKIMETYWRNAGELTKEVAPLLSAEEKFFFNEYKNINVEYQQSFPFEFDLKKDLEPPRHIFIEVRVLEECGEIVGSDGNFISLEKNSTQYVKKSDVEHLIRQGKLIPTENL